MDIGERVIVHGLLEVDGIEDLDAVRLINDPVSYTHLGASKTKS